LVQVVQVVQVVQLQEVTQQDLTAEVLFLVPLHQPVAAVAEVDLMLEVMAHQVVEEVIEQELGVVWELQDKVIQVQVDQ
jgi:hypothetical protein